MHLINEPFIEASTLSNTSDISETFEISSTDFADMLFKDFAASKITFFRLQSSADTKLKAYIAQGEILPVATHSFGGIGVFAIPEMGRFYRHVLVSKNYPHHGAVAFCHVGKALYTLFNYLGITDISYNQPAGVLYADENPFA